MQQKSEFDKRKLFPFTYLFWKKRGVFNAFLFYVDLALWAIPISIIFTFLIVSFV